MKLKLDAEGKPILKDGLPIFVKDDGAEVAIDVGATIAKITQLNGEAKTNRERAEAAEAKLKTFDGIEDPAKALAALQTVKDLKDGELITAGKVEEIRTAARKTAEEQVAAAVKAAGDKQAELESSLATVTSQLHNEKLTNAFANSKFIREKIAVPGDLLRSQFGANFRIEDGVIVPYQADGKSKLYSRAKPGDVADFEEGLEIMVDSYSHRDALLKGKNHSGAGSQQSSGGGGSTMTRAQFEQLSPAEKMKMSQTHQIVD